MRRALPSPSIKSWPSDERPREKLLLRGPEQLSDAELLAVVLPTAAGHAGPVERGRALLVRFGSLRGVLGAAPRALAEVPGLGPARVALLGAVGELARRAV
jgi:DNA repair protein RadC